MHLDNPYSPIACYVYGRKRLLERRGAIPYQPRGRTADKDTILPLVWSKDSACQTTQWGGRDDEGDPRMNAILRD
jgi:hypothetical protein